MKTPFQRILGLNLAILLTLAVALRLVNRSGEGVIVFAIELAVLIGFMMFVNLGFGMVSNTKEEKRAHWLSFFLVLLIGFGACAGGASIRL